VNLQIGKGNREAGIVLEKKTNSIRNSFFEKVLN
jgi:hypothetical protein